ncbi:hypothetical protein NC651_027494 [Populus alba x Populus x berolinensis]|nr:hypothetical protein NC651_027494 [Populus alba x Populus x berolinensis]
MSSTSKPSSKPIMQTYGVAYIDPREKAVSRVDRTGDTSSFFSVDEEFERRRPNSCLVLEIYRVRLVEDQLLKELHGVPRAKHIRRASWNHQYGSSNLERHVSRRDSQVSFFKSCNGPQKVDGPWLEEFLHPVFKNYPSKEGLPHFVACNWPELEIDDILKTKAMKVESPLMTFIQER